MFGILNYDTEIDEHFILSVNHKWNNSSDFILFQERKKKHRKQNRKKINTFFLKR